MQSVCGGEMTSITFTDEELAFLIEKMKVTRVSFLKKTGALSVSNKMCLNEDIDVLKKLLSDRVQEVMKENDTIECLCLKMDVARKKAPGVEGASAKRRFVLVEENDS